MKICLAKHWSHDDWLALSEEAQEWEIAHYDYRTEQRNKVLDILEKKLYNKDGKVIGEMINAYITILLQKLD